MALSETHVGYNTNATAKTLHPAPQNFKWNGIVVPYQISN